MQASLASDTAALYRQSAASLSAAPFAGRATKALKYAEWKAAALQALTLSLSGAALQARPCLELSLGSRVCICSALSGPPASEFTRKRGIVKIKKMIENKETPL